MTRRGVLFAAAAYKLWAREDLGWVAGLGGRMDRDAEGAVSGVHLRGAWVTDAELLDVARLPKLQRLDLSHTRISDEGLLNLKPLKLVEDLNLMYAEQVTDQGITAIRNWTKLRRLNARGTRVFDPTVVIAGGLPQLEAVDLADTQITDNGLSGLVPLTRLKELSIGRSRLGKDALDTLRQLPALEYLDLGGAHPGAGGRTRGAPLSDDVPRAIATLKDLRVLKLGDSQIGIEGLRILRELEKVEKLSLKCCPRVSDDALAELGGWKSLQYLDVQETKVTPSGVEALRKAKPGIVVLSGGA